MQEQELMLNHRTLNKMEIKSVAQYHKLHKIFPILAGKATKETDMSKLPQRVTKPEKKDK